MLSQFGYDPNLDRVIQEDDPTQQSLRDRQLRTLFETALDAIAIADDQGHYIDVNSATCELFGVQKEQILGHCISEFIEAGFNFHQVWQEFQQQEKLRGEFRLVRNDGDIRVIEYAARANFLPHRHLSVMRDITNTKRAEAEVTKLTEKLQQAEEKLTEFNIASINKNKIPDADILKQIASHIPGVIYQLRMAPDGTLHFPYVSKRLQEISGLTPAEVRENAWKFFTIIHPEDIARVTKSIIESAANLTPWYCEYRVALKDGQVLWLLSHSTPQRALDGSTLWYGYIRDITDSKTTELELQHFFSLALDLLCIADFNGYFRRLNRAWETTLGYNIKELEGKRFLDFIHPDDIAATIEIISDLSDRKSIFQFTNRYRAKDGTYRYIEWRATPYGNLIYAAARDITEHKHNEDKLNEISNRLSLALKSGAIGCWEWDIIQNTLVWDERMYELYGVTKNSDTRLAYDIWATGLHPDDRHATETLIHQVVAGKGEYDPEFRVVHPDGSIHFIKAFGSVFRDAVGNAQKMIGLNFDITDRKRQEQALRLIVEGTAAKTGAEFFKTCVQYIAQVLEVKYAVITEFTDTEKTIEKTLAFWECDKFSDNFTCNLTSPNCQHTPCKNISSNTEVYRYQKLPEFCHYQADHNLICLQAESYAGLPILDAAGNRLGLLAVLDDKPMQQDLEIQSAILKIFATRAGAEIERIKAENALRQSEIQLRQQAEELAATLKKLQKTQTQLIQAEKMSSLGQLVGGIAHEINNPVSFIYGNLQHASDYVKDLVELIQLYQKYYTNPPQEIANLTEDMDFDYLVQDFYQLLASMKTGATRIRDIVKSLRIFSRLDEADLKDIDIHENIESTLMILQNRLNGWAGNPHINLIKNYGKIPLIECYGGLLNQVFINLLINAIDAIEQRRKNLEIMEKLDYIGQIIITTTMTTEKQVIISIADNGCGMSPQVQEKIFDPFFTTKPIGQGTGMGLATSYQIITENHHGSLQCFSTEGIGTEFRIELPTMPQK